MNEYIERALGEKVHYLGAGYFCKAGSDVLWRLEGGVFRYLVQDVAGSVRYDGIDSLVRKRPCRSPAVECGNDADSALVRLVDEALAYEDAGDGDAVEGEFGHAAADKDAVEVG